MLGKSNIYSRKMKPNLDWKVDHNSVSNDVENVSVMMEQTILLILKRNCFPVNNKYENVMKQICEKFAVEGENFQSVVVVFCCGIFFISLNHSKQKCSLVIFI